MMYVFGILGKSKGFDRAYKLDKGQATWPVGGKSLSSI